MVKIPFSDIAFDSEERDAVSEVLSSGWVSRGEVSDEFESGLEKYLGSHVALVNSGSSALLCALLANEVKAGDTVLVPDFTFIATASIPAILGARIIPLDCDLETFNLGKLAFPAHCIIGTDVAGVPCGLEASTESTKCIVDAAESLGSETTRYKTGATDCLTCFSFNITKSLTTIEGGAVASKNEELIEKCRSISNYGRTKEQYIHDRLGLNCRITDVASALGLIQLRKLDKNLARRKEIADRYRKELPMFQFQKIPSYVTKSTNFMMIALTHERNHINGHPWQIEKFRSAGIDARPTFMPISRQPCFPELNKHPETNADRIWVEGLTLPIFASMTNEQVEYVIETANN